MQDNNTQTPKREVEDILSSVEPEAKKVKPQPHEFDQAVPAQAPYPETPKKSRKWLFIIISIFLIFFIIILAGALVTRWLQAPTNQYFSDDTEITPQAAVEYSEAAPYVPAPMDDQAERLPDSDNDGLSDEDEAKLGTNVNNSDTDNDGLTDGDEVRFYSSDPLDSDTDGDGFLDGEELKAGFDPNGPGKLLNFQKALKELKKSNQ